MEYEIKITHSLTGSPNYSVVSLSQSKVVFSNSSLAECAAFIQLTLMGIKIAHWGAKPSTEA